jgi:hypothetical protein
MHQPEPTLIGVGLELDMGLTVAMRQYRMNKAKALRQNRCLPASWDDLSLVAD